MSYFKYIKQDVLASTNNSSNIDLLAYPNAGYEFVGLKDSTLGVAGIQVSLFTTENCDVWIEQSPDGNNWDISDHYTYRTITSPNFGITVQAVSSWVRIRVANNSTINSTNGFRLQTALCPIVESLPRALDEDGNLKVAIQSMSDNYGFEAENTPMGDMRVVEPTRLVGAIFEGTTLDTNFWIATVDGGAGTGSVVQSGGQVVLNSGTAAATFSRLNSVRRARYVSGTAMRYRAVVQLGDIGTATNKKRWGVGFGATMPTVTDGAWFQTNGTTFGIATAKNGTSDVVVNSGSFNGEYGSSYVLDTNSQTFEIYWTSSHVYFVINGQILHTVSANTTTWSETTSHYLYADNVNSGNTVNKTLTIRVQSICRLGKLETDSIWKNIRGINAGTVLKYAPGRLQRIVLNSYVASSAISLYDAVSATNPIALIAPATGGAGLSVEYGISFYTGLYIVTANANTDITVIYE